MTDCEMLELAAKAAGYELFGMELRSGICVKQEGGSVFVWNPLVHNDEAFSLAVKLKMVVDTDWNGGAVAGTAEIEPDEPEYGYQEGNGKKDLFAATRLAIVKCASEIGAKL